MFIRLTLIIVLVSVFSTINAMATMRIWTSANGKMIEAEYVCHSMGKIVLKKADGKKITVPPEYLSKKDQVYANKLVPPKLSLDFTKKANSKAKSYDYVHRELEFIVKIEKTSQVPFEGKLKVELFVLGEHVASGKKKMLIHRTWTDLILSNKSGEVLTLSPDPITVKYDDHGYYKLGTKYDSYVFFIFNEEGKLLDAKSSRKILLRNLTNLQKNKLSNL
jgi:hypothetical protein